MPSNVVQRSYPKLLDFIERLSNSDFESMKTPKVFTVK